MTSAWQSCQGDYKPDSLFTRDNMTVIARNIKEVEDGIYQWEECSMPTEDYNAIASVIAENAPYTEVKKGYIDDTEIIFNKIPDGTIMINLSDPNIGYTVTREDDTITVVFDEPLVEVTEVILTIK